MRTRFADGLLFTAGIFAGAAAALVYTILTAATPPTSIIQLEAEHPTTAHYGSQPEIVL